MSSTVNSTVFKIFLPVLIGLAIFATLDSIKVNSLDPSVNSLEGALNSMDRSMTIGDIYTTDQEKDEKKLLEEESSERSKQEVREAILINIVMAQNCDLVTSLNEAEWKNLEPNVPNNPETVYIEYNPDSFDSYKPFMITKDEGEAPITCVGAESPTEKVKPPVQNFVEGPDESIQTNDMEGKFGRINFEVDNTLEFKNPRVGATAIYDNDISETGSFPDFWRANRVVVMVPESLQRQNDCGNWIPDNNNPAKSQATFVPGTENGLSNNKDVNKYDDKLLGNSGNRLIYAFRVRMQNVPIIKEGYAGQRSDFNHGLCTKDESSGIKDFLMDYSTDDPYGNSEAARYIFCEEATGYIQSNAGKMDNTGESSVDKFDLISGYGPEIVFPKLLIRQNADDCLEGGSGDGGKDLTVPDEANIVGPRVDFGNGREKCTYEELKDNYKNGRNAKTWKGNELRCGLTKDSLIQKEGGKIDFYNTVWYTVDSDRCGEKVDHLSSYSSLTKDGNPKTYYGDGKLKLWDMTEEDEVDVRYDFQHYNSIDEVTIGVDDHNRADSRYILEMEDGKTIEVQSGWNWDANPVGDYNNGFDYQIVEDGQETYLGEYEEDVRSSYQIKFDLDEGTISVDGVGSETIDFEGEPESLKVKAGHNYFGGQGND
ncbi:MAG: hypothetical protein BRC26_04125, partial [Nanohaloarchaea archaeon QH_8_44_6]